MLTEDQNSQDHELQQIEELEQIEGDEKTEEDTTEAPETTTTTTESSTTTSKDSEEESTTTEAPETTKTASQNSEENEEDISENLEESENIEKQEETEVPSNGIQSTENLENQLEQSPEEPIDSEEVIAGEVVQEIDAAEAELPGGGDPIEPVPEEIIQEPEEVKEIQEVPQVDQENFVPETNVEESEVVQEQLSENNAEISTSETSQKEEEETENEVVSETKELSQEEILAQALISAMKGSGGLDIQNSIQALLNLQQANQQPTVKETEVEESPEQPAEQPAQVEAVSESAAEEPIIEQQEEITEQETVEAQEEAVIQESLEDDNKPSAIQLTNELQPIPVNEASEAPEDSQAPEDQQQSESIAVEESPAISSQESTDQEPPQNEGSELVVENPEVSDLLAKSEQKIEGFDGLSEAQQAQILAFIKNSVLPGKDEESPVISDDRMEDDGENNEIIQEHIDDPADTGFSSPEDVVQPPTILNSPADIEPEKIDSSLYEEKAGGKVVEYDDDEYNNLNEVEYVEPDAKELMSWEKENNPTEMPKVEKMRTPPPAIFKHYEQEPQYDSLKAAGSRDHYIDIQTELETSGDHSEIIEEIFQDKPNEIDSIFDAPPVELPERSKLQVEDLIAQKQQDLHEDKYRALEREEEESTKSSHKGWMVFMMVIGILFIATTRRKVRRLMPASNRQRASSFSSRHKGPLIAEKRGKESSSEDEGDISGFEDF